MPEGTGQPTGPRTSAVGDRSSDDEISCLFPTSERKCPVFQQTCFLAVFRGSGNTQGKSQYGSCTKPPTFYDQWDMTYDKKDRLKKENPGAPGSPRLSCHWTQNRRSPTTRLPGSGSDFLHPERGSRCLQVGSFLISVSSARRKGCSV